MKFLVNWTLQPMPQEMMETALNLLPMELEYFKKLKDQGKLLAHYTFPGESKGFSICDHESHEDLLETLVNDPFFMFVDFSTKPIVETESAIEAFKGVLEKTLKK